MKPGTPVLRSTRLLDQLRERIHYLHYSLSTEKACLHWVRFSFVEMVAMANCIQQKAVATGGAAHQD